jgi:nicotinamide-nucleotide amidase
MVTKSKVVVTKDAVTEVDAKVDVAARPSPQWLSSGPAMALWSEAAGVDVLLASRGLTLATVESLTGGWLSAALTSIPGSSSVFLAGLTAYSNQAKIALLGVPEEVILTHGAVSLECAGAMALGIRSAIGADIGLATTGIAGPDGGSDKKPVGLVYVGLADGHKVLTQRLLIGGDRLEITLVAATRALSFLHNEMAILDYGDPVLV